MMLMNLMNLIPNILSKIYGFWSVFYSITEATAKHEYESQRVPWKFSFWKHFESLWPQSLLCCFKINFSWYSKHMLQNSMYSLCCPDKPQRVRVNPAQKWHANMKLSASKEFCLNRLGIRSVRITADSIIP